MSGLLDRELFRRDHRWARRRMSDHLDGELPPVGRARMERHLGECAECRHLLASLRRTLEGLHRLSAPGADTNALQIADAVRARLSKPE